MLGLGLAALALSGGLLALVDIVRVSGVAVIVLPALLLAVAVGALALPRKT